jgi:hypothetical protein
MSGNRDEHDKKSPRGVCSASHPLLAEVRCGRLTGHPGRHEAETTEGVGVAWGETEETAG